MATPVRTTLCNNCLEHTRRASEWAPSSERYCTRAWQEIRICERCACAHSNESLRESEPDNHWQQGANLLSIIRAIDTRSIRVYTRMFEQMCALVERRYIGHSTAENLFAVLRILYLQTSAKCAVQYTFWDCSMCALRKWNRACNQHNFNRWNSLTASNINIRNVCLLCCSTSFISKCHTRTIHIGYRSSIIDIIFMKVSFAFIPQNTFTCSHILHQYIGLCEQRYLGNFLHALASVVHNVKCRGLIAFVHYVHTSST